MSVPPVHPFQIDLLRLRRQIAEWLYAKNKTNAIVEEVLEGLKPDPSHGIKPREMVKSAFFHLIGVHVLTDGAVVNK